MDARIPAPVATSRARRLEERRMMMNGRWIGAAVAAAALIASAAPAQAQMAVVDVRAVAQALQTARNTLAQLQEAQRLYQSMNSPPNIRGVANQPHRPILRDAPTGGGTKSTDILASDMRDPAQLGTRAEDTLATGHQP